MFITIYHQIPLVLIPVNLVDYGYNFCFGV